MNAAAGLTGLAAGIAALGAAVVHLGVAATSPAPAMVLLIAVGAAEAAWGVLAIRGPIPLPRLAVPLALLPVAAWIAAVLLPAAGHAAGRTMAAPLLPPGPMLGAAAQDLAVAVLLAVALRRRAVTAPPAPAAFLLVAALSSTAVAVLVANSLAATPLGGGMPMH